MNSSYFDGGRENWSLVYFALVEEKKKTIPAGVEEINRTVMDIISVKATEKLTSEKLTFVDVWEISPIVVEENERTHARS